MTRFRKSAERKPVFCDLCGGYSAELKHTAMEDFHGWVCPECLELLMVAQEKRFMASVEQTEPAE